MKSASSKFTSSWVTAGYYYFDIDYPAAELFSLLKRLCDTYKAIFKKKIRRVLSIEIDSIGLTFGLEMGRLIRFEINEKQEYIGRPINVAARLQSAIKNGDSNPEGKILMSKRAYDHVRGEVSDLYKAQTVTRKLSNVAGGESYRAIKLMLY